MHNPPSPIETLRQLKEMLDAGTITPAEFEALKRKLVFPDAAPASEPIAPPPLAPYTPLPAEQVPPAEISGSFVPPSPAASPVPEPDAATAYKAEAAAPSLSAPMPEPGYDEMQEFAPPAGRNPLNLVLSIGGLLALLALVLYLSFNNRSSEHLTSGSKTAADSVTTVIETGPQAEQPELTEIVPETIRMVPTNPAPPVTARPQPAPAAADSAEASSPAEADSVAP